MESTDKSKSKTPKKMPVKELVVPLIFGALGTVALIRGLLNSSRALVSNGSVSRCAGTSSFGCDSADIVITPPNEPVYSLVPGKVVARGDDFVHILSSYEPVILYYGGINPSVLEGASVSLGQNIGTSTGELVFSVTGIFPTNQVTPIVPGAWLASRGLSHVEGKTGEGYCAGGRTVQVPSDVKSCGFRLPDRPGFSILPISVDMP